MKIKSVIDFLQTIAPPVYQESYDNATLICGSSDWECSGVLLCLDALEEVVDEALARQCNLIVAHHPIVFKGLRSITGRHYVERVLIKAIKNDIAIYASHTNLDNVRQGVNAKIAEILGLTDTQILAPKSDTLRKLYTFCPQAQAAQVRAALFAAGAGHIGNYGECSFNAEGYGTFTANDAAKPFVGEAGKAHQEPETKIEVVFPKHLETSLLQALQAAHPYEEVAYDIVALQNENPQIGSGMVGYLPKPLPENDFLDLLKTAFRVPCVRHTALRGAVVHKVALCGGAGSFLLPKARTQAADAFVTADYKYHEFFDAEQQILIADIGHYESEQFTIDLFYHLLTNKFSNFAVLKTDVCTNPVHYHF
ncbi:MAG: Nif3-like dinuclear metal center hexameric protein [Sphingobacteriales bacterium]|nr:Nif3-like dinuclear metal center hexameric protein [Sphingobacteriales bacterium]